MRVRVPGKRSFWKQAIAVVLLLASIVLVAIVLLCPCGCHSEIASPRRTAEVVTSQPVEFSQDAAIIKAIAQVSSKIDAQATITSKLVEVHQANTCDYWDNRMRTGLIFLLALICGWALYKVQPRGSAHGK